MTAQSGLDEIKARIATSPAVSAMTIDAERAVNDQGYFRARLTLANSDFLEISEYFVVEGREFVTMEYRYQWMDHTQHRLIRRWDNARHFPNLFNFPHHLHVGDDNHVIPGRAR